MNARNLLLSAVVAPALLALAGPRETIAFHPEEGMSVTRTFVSRTQMSLDDLSVDLNGQPSPMPMDIEMDMDMTTTITVTDEYLGVGGRVTKLKRTYDTLESRGSFSMEAPMVPEGSQETTVEAQSELEGKTVVFTWSEEDGEYRVAFEQDSGDPELLEGLDQQMDFTALLPDREVAEGDTWTIDVKSLKSLLMPGGDLSLEPTDADMADQMPGMGQGMGDLSSMIGDLLQGEAAGEYRGTREIDGVTVGVIRVTIDIRSSKDMTELVLKQMGEQPEGMPEFDVDHVDVELEMSGEGTLYWDIAAGVAHSYEMNGRTRMLMDMAMSVEPAPGQNMAIEQRMDMSGTFDTEVTIQKN